MTRKIDSRWKATIVHLFVSAIVLIVILIITSKFWYPRELIHAGAIDGLKIIVGVDIILGPMLTLIIFDIAKKSLKFDLTVIALIQFSCLAFGIWLLYNERPVIQILADNGVHLIANSELELYELKLPEDNSTTNPPAYLLDLPEDWSSLPGLKLTTEFVSKKPFHFRQDLHIDFSSIDKTKVDQRIKKILDNLKAESENQGQTKDGCVWLPVYSIHTYGSACLNYESGVVLLSEHKSIFDF